jgi:hypothetical protein
MDTSENVWRKNTSGSACLRPLSVLPLVLMLALVALPALPFDGIHRSCIHAYEATNEGIDFRSDRVKKKEEVASIFFRCSIAFGTGDESEVVADEVQCVW